MGDSTRLKYLRIALVLVGIIVIFGIYSLMIALAVGLDVRASVSHG